MEMCIYTSIRINRNIVECKVVCDFNLKAIRTGINRNIVECKVQQSIFVSPSKIVLIETLWNVKMSTLKWQIGAK